MAMYFRIKRKRDAEPLDHLLIEAPRPAKRPTGTFRDLHIIEDGKSGASKAKGAPNETLVFRRINTVSAHQASSTDQMLKEKVSVTDYSRRQPSGSQTSSVPTVREVSHYLLDEAGNVMVDLSIDGDEKMNQSTVTITSGSKILNPLQRQMDEAVWRAYCEGDFSLVFQLLPNQDVNFQRPIDGVSALMAAAFHNRHDVVERLLLMNAVATLRDNRGKVASDIALASGYQAVGKLLKESEMNEQSHNHVFDIYCTDGKMVKKVSEKQTEGAVVSAISTEIEEWLSTADFIKSEIEHAKDFESDSDERYASDSENEIDYPDELNSDGSNDDDY